MGAVVDDLNHTRLKAKGCLIVGDWQPTASGGVFGVVSPSDGKSSPRPPKITISNRFCC